MDRSRTLPFLTPALLIVLVAAGCGGQTADELSTDEAAMASAPVTEVEAGECFLQGATLEEAQARQSPLQDVEFAFDGGTGRLCYGAPSANGRDVMGALVPHGALWRAGANEPTTIHLSAPASVGGVALEPGSYSLYALPGEDSWQFFLNSNYERWGIPISDELRTGEVGSFEVTPSALDEMVETLRFRFEGDAENTMGDLVMEWENTQLRFHVHPGG